MVEIQGFMISAIIISVGFVALLSFQNSVAGFYGVDSIADIPELSSLQNVSDISDSMSSSLQRAQLTGTFFDIPLVAMSGAYEALKLMFSIGDVYSSFAYAISSQLHMPTWVFNFAMLVVGIIIIFAIFTAIFKVRI